MEEGGTPAVPFMSFPAGYACSGTLIRDKVVLTAAHCVVEDVLADNRGGLAFFGPNISDSEEEIAIVGLAMHPFYDNSNVRHYDIALVKLFEVPQTATPLPVNLDPLDQGLQGSPVRAVGFGVNDGPGQTGAGIKRTVDLTLDSITEEHVGFGDEAGNTCQGDSGGPIFLEVDGQESVIGVVSYGGDQCRAQSKASRPDIHRAFLEEVLDAWDGPCQFDGDCVTDCPGYPDPDCDPCGFEGFCAQDCPKLDLDCGPFGFEGDPCKRNSACATGLCVEALDDPRVKYCSAECSEPADCADPLAACEDGVCHYAGPSPGAQGWPCESGDDCRSGVCDPDGNICIEQCGDGFAACGADYECRDISGVQACRLPGEGGGCGCRAGGRDQGVAALALLGFALLVARRTDRRRGRR